MKEFYITITEPVMNVYSTVVTAETEEEAREIVAAGDCETEFCESRSLGYVGVNGDVIIDYVEKMDAGEEE